MKLRVNFHTYWRRHLPTLRGVLLATVALAVTVVALRVVEPSPSAGHWLLRWLLLLAHALLAVALLLYGVVLLLVALLVLQSLVETLELRDGRLLHRSFPGGVRSVDVAEVARLRRATVRSWRFKAPADAVETASGTAAILAWRHAWGPRLDELWAAAGLEPTGSYGDRTRLRTRLELEPETGARG